MDISEVILEINRNEDYEILSVNVKVPTLRRKENGHYFIQCPFFKSLGHSTESFEAAREDHKLDIQIFLKTHIDRGTLITALNSLGWDSIGVDQFESPNIHSGLLSNAEPQTVLVSP